MNRHWIFLPALSLIATLQTGCVALAIPALTSGAIVGKELDRGGSDGDPVEPVAAEPAAALGTAPTAAITASAIAPLPEPGEAYGLVPFARYGHDLVEDAGAAATLVSAILSDPVALDGQRRRCETGVQPMALIDMDPSSGLTNLPRNPPLQPRISWELAHLRAAGITIVWLTDRPVEETAALRSALAKAGLDPRGDDIVSLRRDQADLKHLRRDDFAATSCVIAIAGDERSDFDERFRYLRTPEVGAGLEPIIGNGWFLVEPVFAKVKETDQ